MYILLSLNTDGTIVWEEKQFQADNLCKYGHSSDTSHSI